MGELDRIFWCLLLDYTAYVKFVSILGLRDRSLFMDGVGAEEKPRVAEFS